METLPAPLRVIAQSFITWWDAAISLAILNVLCSLAWVTVILGPPVTFGLYYVANELGHGRDVGISGLFNGTRRYFWQSWLWGLPNFLLAAIILVEAPFLQRFPLFVPLIGLVVVLWFMVQFYGLPYFMEQEEKNLLVAWQNGLFTALASPIYTLIIALCATLIIAVSVITVAPLFFGSVSLMAVLGTNAILNRIETFGLRQ